MKKLIEIELYKEILSFRKHNDTILMSEASILTALTSGLIYAYGTYAGSIISAYIAIVGIASSICFLLLMRQMVLGAEARDKIAKDIEKKLGFKHINYVKFYMKFCRWSVKARHIIIGYGIFLMILWLSLFTAALDYLIASC
jgi:hypothetical protein